MAEPVQPITILVAALGGEGGGVLSDWLIAAAMRIGLPVQSTSVPGVAQRTGATVYYLELFPQAVAPGAPGPVLALTPTPGDIDVVLASELLEAGRAIQNGFVTPERTTLIASTHRVFAIAEKSAMADGRFDGQGILEAAKLLARHLLLCNLSALAAEAGCPISAVLFGALIGSGRLPIGREVAEDCIRAGGKAVEANLRGFAAGLEAAQGRPSEAGRAGDEASGSVVSVAPGSEWPEAVRALVELGMQRLIEYQDRAYAELYARRLREVLEVERRAGGRDLALTREVARHLALWMSYEDVIRVADLKSRAERWARVREEVRARDGEIVRVVDFLKPGIAELASLLPPRAGGALRDLARRRGWLGRAHLGLRVRSTTVSGFLMMRMLAGLRPLRRRTLRYAEEQAMIEDWLAAIRRQAEVDLQAAGEIAGCAQLVKGYGETLGRGLCNYRRIAEALFAGRGTGPAIAAARRAALADPEGATLDEVLAELERRDGAEMEPAPVECPLERRAGP